MTSLVDRLRAAIEERKALAEAATQGEWIDDGGIYVGHETNEIVDYVYRDEDQAHIVANQPSTVTRRCAADLAELGRHTPRRDSKDCPVCVAGAGVMDAGDEEYSYAVLVYEAPPCGFVRYLAGAYGITEEET